MQFTGHDTFEAHELWLAAKSLKDLIQIMWKIVCELTGLKLQISEKPLTKNYDIKGTVPLRQNPASEKWAD